MKNYFSENLKRLRKERELTQEALADFIGVSYQAVSKWERGENLPDITLLPVIAQFFGTSIDGLLGVDLNEREKEILAVIDKFDNGKYKGTDGALSFMSEARQKFPSDFRILVRYLHALIADLSTDHLQEIESVFDRIQNYCADDRIRIYAKNLMIHYYKTLTRKANSGKTMQDVYALVETMPDLRDSKDYLISHIPDSEEDIQAGCRTLIDNLIFCLNNAVYHFVFYRKPNDPEVSCESIELAVKALELMNSVNAAFYTDGNYGVSWRQIIYNYGNLGQGYHKLGDDEKAYENLTICAKLAKKFDMMPNITERSSLFFQGEKLNKQEQVAVYLDTSLCDQMTRYMTKYYALSDDFKSNDRFAEILDIMKS